MLGIAIQSDPRLHSKNPRSTTRDFCYGKTLDGFQKINFSGHCEYVGYLKASRCGYL